MRRVTELTQPGRRKPKTGRAALLAIAITAVVAGAGALAYVVGWGVADDKASNAAPTAVTDVAKQMECTSIKREYDAWRKGAGLQEIERLRGKFAAAAAKKAAEDAAALSKATTGYTDKPALALAVAAGNYNFAVGILSLQANVTNDYEDKDFQTAMAAQSDVNVKFNEFWAATCS